MTKHTPNKSKENIATTRPTPTTAKPRDACWLAGVKSTSDILMKWFPLKVVMERMLDKYLEHRGSPDLKALNLTKKNLLDLFWFQEFSRCLRATADGYVSDPSYRVETMPSPEEVNEVSFKACSMNWIPVNELRFLFRNVELVELIGVGGKIDLRDLLALPNVRSLILRDLPMTEFPYFLARHKNLSELAISHTKIEKVDFTGQEPFTDLKGISLGSGVGNTPLEIRGLVRGLPALKLVLALGPVDVQLWKRLVSAYPAPRKIDVLDIML